MKKLETVHIRGILLFKDIKENLKKWFLDSSRNVIIITTKFKKCYNNNNKIVFFSVHSRVSTDNYYNQERFFLIISK